MPPAPPADKQLAGEDAPPDLSSLSVDLGKRWSTATESIRTRTDTTAKGIAALGTTGITAAGLTKFSDVFPLPASPTLWQGLAICFVIAAFSALAAAVALFTARLAKVSSPLFMKAKAADISDASTEEQTVIADIYQETADLNDANTFEVYTARGSRLQRVAQSTPDAKIATLAATEAKQINADVVATQARAATNVIRKRAQDAIHGKDAWKPYALFIAGLLVFGFATDYLDSERSARVATAKSCAEAITAIRTADPTAAEPPPSRLLPKLCGGRSAVPKPAASAAATTQTETAGAVKDLATRYDACVTAAKGKEPKCAEIKAAMHAVLPQ